MIIGMQRIVLNRVDNTFSMLQGFWQRIANVSLMTWLSVHQGGDQCHD
jgi:hypothetical protein